MQTVLSLVYFFKIVLNILCYHKQCSKSHVILTLEIRTKIYKELILFSSMSLTYLVFTLAWMAPWVSSVSGYLPNLLKFLLYIVCFTYSPGVSRLTERAHTHEHKTVIFKRLKGSKSLRPKEKSKESGLWKNHPDSNQPHDGPQSQLILLSFFDKSLK